MKRTLIICMCLFMSYGVARAQELREGDMFLKGELGVQALGNFDYTYCLLSVSPQFEYFYRDNRSVGAKVSYTEFAQISGGVVGDVYEKNKDSYMLAMVGPTLKWYLALSARLYVSIDCFFGYAGLFGKSSYSVGGSSISDGWGFMHAGLVTVTPTLNFMATDKFVLTASFGNINAIAGVADGEFIATAGVHFGGMMLGVGFRF